ncbi:MAG: transketolase [Alphaproteobacteria bacterium]|nr:transketolase [Alphaproteobacteria bacterium]
MKEHLSQMADAVRFLSVDMIEKAKSGHPGMPLGMADIATILWTQFLNIDPSTPNWINRDRFILSNGHGSALLYSLLHLAGFKDASLEELKQFRQLGSKTAGHPEKGVMSGVDFSTGPLGQGIAGAVGMALAERILNAKYGDGLINHKTYVFAGDGCLMEGISEEAISLAGHLKLKNLIVLWDDNQITIDGSTDITSSTNMKMRFEANNWMVLSCDGHNFEEIESVLQQAQQSEKPVLIDCKTVIGYGAPTKAGKSASHGSPLGSDEIEGLRKSLNWEYEPFVVPEDVLKLWKDSFEKGKEKRLLWEKTYQHHPLKEQFDIQIKSYISQEIKNLLKEYKKEQIVNKKGMATRKSSQQVLDLLMKNIPSLISGSADLAGACYTKTSTAIPITSQNYNGNYINYGIREHVMGAIMNGLAVHGGFIPLGSTFLSFVDYMKPAIRLACLMEEREIYVLTHDSLGVGEDGPTHQPIEQLASLRATPNLNVFRPADSIEMAECYELALENKKTPSAIVCSRQELPVLRKDIKMNMSARGAYVISDTIGERDVTLIATGSEVALAVEAQQELLKNDIHAAVVSMPCRELFEKQSIEYQMFILGNAPHLIIEAASSFGWDRFIGETGAILSVDTFGCSAPGKVVLEKYGFSVSNIENIVSELISLKEE